MLGGDIVQAFIISTAAGALALAASPVCTVSLPEAQLNQTWAESAFSKARDAELPFSFVYGGKPSRGFIGSWKRSVKERKLSSTSRQRTLTLLDPATSLGRSLAPAAIHQMRACRSTPLSG